MKRAFMLAAVAFAALTLAGATNQLSRISSRSVDFDHGEGVILFDGEVVADYPGYQMCADRIFVFLKNTNRLHRVVALGNVVITNESRVGRCDRATYNKDRNEVVMYPAAAGNKVFLADHGANQSEIEGDRIIFWLDAEQVEIKNSRITVQTDEKKRSFLP